MCIRELTMGRGVSHLSDGAVRRPPGPVCVPSNLPKCLTDGPHMVVLHTFMYTDWTSCREPGRWASSQCKNREGHPPPSTRRVHRAPRGQTESRRIYSANARPFMAVTSPPPLDTLQLPLGRGGTQYRPVTGPRQRHQDLQCVPVILGVVSFHRRVHLSSSPFPYLPCFASTFSSGLVLRHSDP